jgi:hypothetical protein
MNVVQRVQVGLYTIRGVPIFMVFVGSLIHEIKNPTNNDTWEAVTLDR